LSSSTTPRHKLLVVSNRAPVSYQRESNGDRVARRGGGGVVTALNIDTIVPAIEHAFHFEILSREVYYISELPSDLHASDVIVSAVVSLFLSFVATLYPSWRAARVNPAEALRYE
jgi:ABC-type antimicrobial peptide transport system permease subunit